MIIASYTNIATIAMNRPIWSYYLAWNTVSLILLLLFIQVFVGRCYSWIGKAYLDIGVYVETHGHCN